MRAAIVAATLSLCGVTADGQVAKDPAWPLRLGELDAARRRHPYQPMNASAKVLVRLARQAGIELESGQTVAVRNRDLAPLTAWMSEQIRRTGDAVSAPAGEAAELLAEHEKALGEIRDFLVRHRDVRFEIDVDRGPAAPVPNVGGRLRLTRYLVASALSSMARRDPVAEDYLEAAWNLQRDLWKRPEMVSTMTALFGTRIVAATARRLPSSPPWLGEILALDPVRAVAAAQQSSTWLFRKTEEEIAKSDSGGDLVSGLFDRVMEPFSLMRVGNTVALVRLSTELGVASQACSFDAAGYRAAMSRTTPFWNRSSRNVTLDADVWVRVHRFRAERELTQKVLAWKSGVPPDSRSSCSDGRWVIEGKTIRYSTHIPPPSRNLPIPLSYSMH